MLEDLEQDMLLASLLALAFRCSMAGLTAGLRSAFFPCFFFIAEVRKTLFGFTEVPSNRARELPNHSGFTGGERSGMGKARLPL